MSGVVVASIGSLYDRTIVDTGKEPELLFLVSFLVTFGFIRTSAHMIRAQVSWWPGNVQVGGTHIHHLVWGICTLLIVGYLEIAVSPESPWHEVLAVLFGVGAGLTLDEFALWLNLKDVYWSEQGRRSIDAVIVMAAFAGIVTIGFRAWIDVARDVESIVFSGVGVFGYLTIALVIVNFAKEKFVTGLVGLFVPIVALVGAVRLGKPHSLWAHFFYGDDRKAKATARIDREEKPLHSVRGRLRRRRGGDQSPADSG
jgi:lysyl-tRNA synthetase class 2